MALCRTVVQKQYRAQGRAVSPHRHAWWSPALGLAPTAASPPLWCLRRRSLSRPVCLKICRFGSAAPRGANLGVKRISVSVSAQTFMEDVKSRGPFIYSVLESAQAFLAQHPFQEPEETLTEGKGPLASRAASPWCRPMSRLRAAQGERQSSHGGIHAGKTGRYEALDTAPSLLAHSGKASVSRLITEHLGPQINKQQHWSCPLWCVV